MSARSLSLCIPAACILVLTGCASTGLVLPQGMTEPFPNYESVFEQATAACQAVRTMEFAVKISARSGNRQLRGNLLAALARPASLRLVGVAAFGPPGFVLVADKNSATFVLPREQRVLTDVTPDEMIASLSGVTLGAAEFRSVLTGCFVLEPETLRARVHQNGWIAVELRDQSTVYVDVVDNNPIVVAGNRKGLTVWYSDHVRGLPRRIDLQALSPAGVHTELIATLSQVSINVQLGAEVFVAQNVDDYIPMTFEEFRGIDRPLDIPSAGLTLPQ